MLIVVFWLLGEAVALLTAVPIPGSILGLFLVLGLLVSKRLSLSTVQRGARWFLAEMLLFFVPAVVAVMDHPEFLGLLGLKILAAILLGTFLVMTVTALVVDVGYRWSISRRGYADVPK